MPTRIIREGILTSEKVNRLGWAEEVFYRRLMSVVDDYGRCEAHTTLLRAAMYPLKLDRVKVATVEKMLGAIEAAGLVRSYAAGTKRYLEVLNFRQQTRSPSRFPAPTGMGVADPKQCASGDEQRLTDAKHCLARVHLGVVGDGGVVEGEGEVGSVTRGREGKRSVQSLLPTDQPEPIRSRMLALNSLSRRKDATRWSAKELKAFHEAELGQLTAEDWAEQFEPLSSYYQAPVQELRDFQGTRGDEDYRRRSLLTLLNDWPGQVDKARGWFHAQSKKNAVRDAGRLPVHLAPNEVAI